MGRRKQGTVTGADLSPSDRAKRGKRSSKESKHFETPTETPSQSSPHQSDNGLKERLQEKLGVATNAIGGVANAARQVGNGVKAVRRAVSGGSSLVTDESDSVLEAAKKLASDYNLELIDLKGELSGDPYETSDSLPELDAKEANQRKLKIQRQNNALDVRLERRKQQRKVAAVQKEELNLIGDLADIRTIGFNVAQKYVKSEIARTDLMTEQSKLEEHEELLTQQIIRTQGVINLTEGIRTEWDLRLQKQERSNERLEIEVEKAKNENEQRREEAEAIIFS